MTSVLRLIRWWSILAVMVLLVGFGPRGGPVMKPAVYGAPIPDGGSVYFVGNSFFAWGSTNLPQWVSALGRAEGIPIQTDADIVPGDHLLQDFLDHPSVRKALASRKYSVWILQGHELEAVDHPQEFRQAVRNFSKAIIGAGGKPILFMTWEFPWRHFIAEVSDAYESIGQELGIPIIPAGLVYRSLEMDHPPGMAPFFMTATKDKPGGDLHENVFGAAVNTYVTYAILTGRDPVGHYFSAPGNDLDPGFLRYLSDQSWALAAPRLKQMVFSLPVSP